MNASWWPAPAPPLLLDGLIATSFLRMAERRISMRARRWYDSAMSRARSNVTFRWSTSWENKTCKQFIFSLLWQNGGDKVIFESTDVALRLGSLAMNLSQRLLITVSFCCRRTVSANIHECCSRKIHLLMPPKIWLNIFFDSKMIHLVVAVDPGLNLAFQDQSHQLIFQICHGRIERRSHQLEVCWHIWIEILDQRSVPKTGKKTDLLGILEIKIVWTISFHSRYIYYLIML